MQTAANKARRDSETVSEASPQASLAESGRRACLFQQPTLVLSPRLSSSLISLSTSSYLPISISHMILPSMHYQVVSIKFQVLLSDV